MCVTNDTSELNIAEDHGEHVKTVYILALVSIMCPGIILNIFAIVIFGKNLSRCSHQASLLLFSMAWTDTLAAVQVTLSHGIGMYNQPDTKLNCGVIAFLQSIFPMYSAFIASLMAVDRYLALCRPYFYREHIGPLQGRCSLLISAIITTVICVFPFIGLGQYYTESMGSNANNSTAVLTVRCRLMESPDGSSSVFGYVYGGFGLIMIAVVITCNGFVMNAVLKMRNIVIPSVDSATEQLARVEVIFAKVMAGLAVIFLICWTPYMVSIILMAYNVNLAFGTLSTIHTIAGLNYVIDPFVYIFMRRKYRQSVLRVIRTIFQTRHPSATDINNGHNSVVPFF